MLKGVVAVAADIKIYFFGHARLRKIVYECKF